MLSLLFLLILCLVKVSFAADVTTSFETTDLSGSFTLGTSPNTVTFTNGEAKFAGILSLYRTGSQAFMVQNNTAMVTFETPAVIIDVYLRAQSGAVGAVVNVYDINDNIVDSYTATTSWQTISINSNEGISRMELINNNPSYAVFDDFSFTALTAPPPPGDPIKLDDPLPLPIFSGLKLKLELVTTGLTAPLWGVAAPGVSDFFYVVEQTGQILAINKSDGIATVLMDISADLVTIGIPEFGGFDERGLLGIAFHPDFASNNKFYTYSSQPNGAMADFSTMPINTVADHQGVLTEWLADIGGAEGIIIDMASARELLRIDEPQFNHNGGAIAFDSNGLLYVAIGDGGGADDVDGQDFINSPMIGHGDSGNGQNIETILGTIIRINPLGNNSANGAYGIPDSNPMVNAAGLDEIYAYGLRNPYRLSFDSQTGELYAADVGQNDIEEINIITSGGNYGWNIREGSFGFFPNGNDNGYVFEQADDMNTIDPFIEYDHDEGIAVIGGFVYHGSIDTQLQGHYVFGDYNGRIFYINQESTIAEFQNVDNVSVGSILGFAEDSDGELYLLTNATGIPAGSTGSIYQLSTIPNNPPVADAGVTQTVNENQFVTLDASMSSDPDNDTINFEWAQTSGTSVTLSSRTVAKPTFTAPSISSTTTLTFRVTVDDGHLATTAEVDITVNDVPMDSGGGGGGSFHYLLLFLGYSLLRTANKKQLDL
ncbi:hypothetical protein A9Q98_01295 [Thalassotalea sp. 42_200_T64]|nr:hypothetical protein A9Q98_01295 [Thalassotalea sp. 42_200_T64]